MSLNKTIYQDYIKAMKSKDAVRSSTINFLRAQIKNIMINEKRDDISDEDVIQVIRKQVKQREDSISTFRQGGREDLVEQELQQLKILKEYLPQELSENELQEIVNAVIEEVRPKSMKEMGVVIKAVSGKANGRADNKRISELVKKALNV